MKHPSVAAFWAERLGCPVSAFEQPGLTLVPHPLRDRVFVLASGAAVVVAAAEALHARLRAATEAHALVTPEVLRPLMPSGARLIGPARIAYLHGALSAPDGITRLGSASDPRLRTLREHATSEEWEHANLEAAEPPLFACPAGEEIAAASGFERLATRVAHLGVVTDPRHRGRGLGRAAVQAAAVHALELGLLPQYQTLASNAAALRIAESLGFEPFAITLAARLS
jgi:GNAT superfamily N-acetyltransferase